MKLRQWTLVRQICAILLVVCLVSFASGFLVMAAMQEESLNALYNQTVELIAADIREASAQIESVEQAAYNVIVSDTAQTAASAYLDAVEAGAGASVLKQYVDVIGNVAARQMLDNGGIVCANYIDYNGAVWVTAATGYLKLDEAEAERVASAGIAAQGATLLLSGDAPNTLLVVKELREKRGLSMRHVGVLALVVDMDDIGSRLMEQYDGVYLLEGEGFRYLLPGDAPEAAEALKNAPREGGRGFALLRGDSRTYFSVRVPGRPFDCTVLVAYNDMVSAHRARFLRYIGVFLAVCALACALGFALTHRAAGDFQRLIRHLCRISGEDRQVIPPLAESTHRNRESAELYASFNSMARRVNALVDDNYRKQLLIKETQLSVLQAQMNPHFIYNTLNSIYWAARESGNDAVASMTDALSRLLRESVNISETLVSVDGELAIVTNYIRIQKFRFGDRLAISFDLSEDVSALAIPKFTLQVLIENAINHGADRMLGRCEMEVYMRREGERLICRVSNTGPAPEDDLMDKLRTGQIHGTGSGIGLINLERRLKALLGEDSAVAIRRDEAAGRTIVEITCRAMAMDGGAGAAGEDEHD